VYHEGRHTPMRAVPASANVSARELRNECHAET
jgi:hypothetical protein